MLSFFPLFIIIVIIIIVFFFFNLAGYMGFPSMLGAFISTTIYDKACRRFSVCVESALCDIVAGLLSSATTARCRRQSSRVYQEGCV